MPNWKKLIVSGSDANLSNLSVTNAVTASYFKGDGSALTNVQTQVTEVATVVDSFTSQTSVTTFHNFDTKNILVSVYDDNDQQIIPASVSTSNVNSVTVTFDVSTSGRIVVAKGGHIVSGLGTASDSNTLNGQSGSYYLDYDNFTNVPVDIISSSAQLAADISGSIEGPLNVLRAYTSSYATTGSNTFNGNQIITGSLTTSGSTVSFLAHPWPTFGDESHIIKTQGYTASFNGLDRSYAYSGIGLDNFQSGSGWYNHSIVTYTYDNHDNPDYGGELNVGPTRTHMRQLASGSDSAANVSVNEFYGGETAALIYGDLIQLGAYRGNLIEIGNNSSTVIISGSSVKVNSDITASGHLVPSTTETYDLGTPSLKWRDLYISGGTIYLGDTTITQDNVIISSNLQSSLPTGTISSSAQIASDISGSFTALSSSLSTRLSTDELNIANLQSDSGSFSARVTNNEAAISSINAYTGSLKNALTLDGQNVTVVGNLTVSGTTTTVNSTTLDIGDNIISLNGTGATLGGLSVNDGPLSGSLLWDGNANQWIAGPSGSEEKIAIASQVSGSFTSLSGSLSTRLTTDELNISNLQSDSGSFSTRVTTNESNITNLQSDSGSFSTRVSTNEGAITNLQSDSGSFSTRVTTNEGAITNLQSDSGSFSTRVSQVESDIANLDSTYATDAELNASSSALIAELNTSSSALVYQFTTADTNLSSSLATDLTSEYTTADTALSSSLAADIASNLGAIGDLQSDSGSFSTRVTAQEQFSSSLSTTAATYSGSFSGSFVGDGSQLSGVTSYTDSDTLSYINTLAVVSGSASQVKTFLNITESDISDLTHTDISALNAATSSYALAANISGSFTAASSSFSSRVSTLEATDILYDGRLDSIEAATSSYALTANISGSFTAASSSFSSRVSTLEAETSSYALAANISGSFTSLSSSVASDVSNKLEISATSSFAKVNINNSFAGIQTFESIAVNGTASFAYITSVTGSAKIIGDNYIILNADSPTERYSGLKVIDSGSAGATGSLEYDSVANHWFYESTSENYAAVLMSGPKATRGSLSVPTSGSLVVAAGNHLYSSNVSDLNGTVTIGVNTDVNGTLDATNLAIGGTTLDQDIATLSLPASTTISTFGASLIDDTDAATGRTTLGLGSAATKSSTTSVTNGSTALPDGNAVYDFVVGQGYLTSYSETDTLATVTARGATTSTDMTVGNVFTIKGSSPYIQWHNATGTRLGYIQHNETDLVMSSDTGKITLDPSSGIVETAGTLRTLTGNGIQLRNSANSANVGGFSRRGLWEGNANYDPALWAETGYGLYFYTNGSATSKFSLDTNGNGTLAGTLDVNGSTLTVGDSFQAGTSVAAGYYQDASNGAYRAIGTTGTTGYYYQTNAGGSTYMYVGLTGTYAGRVGIGTTTPGYNLHVAGNGYFNTTLYVNGATTLDDDVIITGDLKLNGTDSFIWTPNTSTGYTGFWDQYNARVAAKWQNNLGWGFLGDPESGFAVKVTGNTKVTGNLEVDGYIQADLNTASSRDKIRLWSDSSYTIGMQSGVTFGGLNDWAMTFQFNSENDRGFWWGDTAHSTAQGAMALTTNGDLTVASKVKVGYGESDTATPTIPLQVYGSGSTVFEVEGSVGQLFSIDDDLTGEIFAVSDISGIPILSVDSSGVVTVDDTLNVTGDITAYFSSDERLKKNIKPIESPLEKLKLISGNTFEWDEENTAHKNTGKDVGVIAQEIEKVLPELVTERRGGYKAVQYDKIVALLIESNKALLERVEELEKKLK